MYLIQRYMFVLFVCLSMTNYARHEELEKVFAAETIDRFQGEICCALKNEAEIQACAEFKLCMAQALAQGIESGRKPLKGVAVAAGGLVAASICSMVSLLLSHGIGMPLNFSARIFWVSGLFWGVAAGYEVHRLFDAKDRNRIQYAGVLFEEYFKNLEQNTFDGDEALEEEFNARCRGHRLLENSPVFAQYRSMMLHRN